MRTARDVRVLRLHGDRFLVVGCDSCGGIGPKRLDMVRVSGQVVGKFTARVALMEVLSTGATPIFLAATMSVEPAPTGDDILKGIEEEVKTLNLPSRLVMTGSSEKNFPVEQTGLGVTVVGTVASSKLKIGCSIAGDIAVSIGLPVVGEEVLAAEKKRLIADLRDLQKLLRERFIHEVIPAGSKGILHEANTVADDSKLSFMPEEDTEIETDRPAGPATVLVATLPSMRLHALRKTTSKPVSVIGHLWSKGKWS